jgi:hypothetical protein
MEYPAHRHIDVPVNGASRIRLSVGDGTNVETACWCSMRLTK